MCYGDEDQGSTVSQSTSPQSEADCQGDNGLPELQHPVMITKSDGVCSQSREEIQGWLYHTCLLYYADY